MRYKILGRHTGVRVSELILGAGNFGTGYGYGAESSEADRVLGLYKDAGGNFIDTADQYQAGQSEENVGRWLKGPRRNDFFLATKYSMYSNFDGGLMVTGNSRKNMVFAVEQSLKRLQTDRIDLYWTHFADDVTPVEEIMRGFEDLHRAGKILYAGLSNFMAWRVARAATLAEVRGSLPLAAIQFEYSLLERTSDYELMPMSSALGLGRCAYSPLGGGSLTGKYRRGESGRREGFHGRVFQAENSDQRTATIDATLHVAEQIGATPSQVALAWVASRDCLTIIGPRTAEQLNDNLGCLDVKLSAEHLAQLDAASRPPAIYPGNTYVDECRAQLAGNQLQNVDFPTIATP